MQMEVPVRVHVVECKSGGAVGFELRGDLSGELPAPGSVESNLRAVTCQVVPEPSATVDEASNVGAFRHRLAVDENDVQAHAQVRQAPRALYRVGRGRRADHQAGGAQYAFPVCFFHGGVDGFTKAEIVRRYDQMVQCASSRRSRKKAKNSMPSRNRRTSISGLRAISETIDAILVARK